MSKKKKHRAAEAAIRAALHARSVRAERDWAGSRLESVSRTAPRLFDDERYAPALERLAALEHVRRPEEWRPRGKGRDTLFRSLAEHLLATVPVPAIAWSAFHDEQADALVPLAAEIARGGSLYDFVRRTFPIPLTRRMCHELLAAPSSLGLLDAIRATQARVAGTTPRFFAAWRATRYAQSIGTLDEERFRYGVVEWFARACMLHPEHVGPLFDFIEHRRREDGAFSMTGRSPIALLRAMHAWHGELTFDRTSSVKIFTRSGFEELFYRASDETWRIRELLTARALAHEGRRMGHCVRSYVGRVEAGDTSIGSVQMDAGRGESDNLHVATLEVRNDRRRVVQARGRFNRPIGSRELAVIRPWAGSNGLTMSLGKW